MPRSAARPAPVKTVPARPAAGKKPAPAKKQAPAKKPAATKKAAAARPAAPVGNPAEKAVDKAALKLVRDGFTMPQQDFDLIAALKKRAITLHRPAKKSELLRAALHVLHGLPDKSLLAALEGLVQLKLGRPKKGG